MKFFSRLLIAAALCVSGSVAVAAPGHGDHDRRGQGNSHQQRHYDRRHDNRHHDDHRRYDNRRYVYREARPRYYGNHHRWERGHRYYGPTYVVRDYRHYHLRQPPRGYRWVQSNNDYLLVAIATGIILDIAMR